MTKGGLDTEIRKHKQPITNADISAALAHNADGGPKPVAVEDIVGLFFPVSLFSIRFYNWVRIENFFFSKIQAFLKSSTPAAVTAREAILLHGITSHTVELLRICVAGYAERVRAQVNNAFRSSVTSRCWRFSFSKKFGVAMMKNNNDLYLVQDLPSKESIAAKKDTTAARQLPQSQLVEMLRAIVAPSCPQAKKDEMFSKLAKAHPYDQTTRTLFTLLLSQETNELLGRDDVEMYCVDGREDDLTSCFVSSKNIYIYKFLMRFRFRFEKWNQF